MTCQLLPALCLFLRVVPSYSLNVDDWDAMVPIQRRWKTPTRTPIFACWASCSICSVYVVLNVVCICTMYNSKKWRDVACVEAVWGPLKCWCFIEVNDYTIQLIPMNWLYIYIVHIYVCASCHEIHTFHRRWVHCDVPAICCEPFWFGSHDQSLSSATPISGFRHFVLRSEPKAGSQSFTRRCATKNRFFHLHSAGGFTPLLLGRWICEGEAFCSHRKCPIVRSPNYSDFWT